MGRWKREKKYIQREEIYRDKNICREKWNILIKQKKYILFFQRKESHLRIINIQRKEMQKKLIQSNKNKWKKTCYYSRFQSCFPRKKWRKCQPERI